MRTIDKIKELVIKHGGTPCRSGRTSDQIKELTKILGGTPCDSDNMAEAVGGLCGCEIGGGGTSDALLIVHSVVEGGNVGDKKAYKSITIKTESVGAEAFYQCSKLESVTLDGVMSIGDSAFRNCIFITDVSLPAGVTYVGQSAFAECVSMTEVTFKGKPNTIASNAFANCPDLVTMNVSWAEGAVVGAPWGAKNATINYNYTEE